MDKSLDELEDEIGSFRVKMLLMEDNIENRIKVDKEAAGDDWQQYYDGECSCCGRLWESEFMMPATTENYCIPCWRKNNDLPKLDIDDADLN